MAAATSSKALKEKKSGGSALGAPAQRAQSSRKGKRAWRKNIDLDVVDDALEEAREEERVVGSRLHERPNAELFTIDTSGDANVRTSLPRPRANLSSLRSTSILSQRSAVPAVHSRLPTTSSSTSFSNSTSITKRKHISPSEKERLLRIAKRPRKGPLNSLVDETELGRGSALFDPSAATQQAGYDVWTSSASDDQAHVPESVRKVDPKVPNHANPRDVIDIPAIHAPHAGTSYNPTAQDHSSLLSEAVSAEEKRLLESSKFAGIKERFAGAKGEEIPGVPTGMVVASGDTAGIGGEEEEEEVEGGMGVLAPRKVPRMKTRAQRARALKLREQKAALADQIRRKRLLASVGGAKKLRVGMEKERVSRTRVREEREEKEREKLKSGLAGSKVGRFKVQEGGIDVQLGEDLSESLRGLKVEGNLFRDRFLSLQHRGLVEPRNLVVARRKQARMKEFEKHAWKRFN